MMDEYMRRMMRAMMAGNLLPSEIERAARATFHVAVYHDSWCDHLNRHGRCNCDPDMFFIRGPKVMSILADGSIVEKEQ
jgi:hypothetical protein